MAKKPKVKKEKFVPADIELRLAAYLQLIDPPPENEEAARKRELKALIIGFRNHLAIKAKPDDEAMDILTAHGHATKFNSRETNIATTSAILTAAMGMI